MRRAALLQAGPFAPQFRSLIAPETLEDRCLLNADTLLRDSAASNLNLSSDAFDSSSVLVRFQPDATDSRAAGRPIMTNELSHVLGRREYSIVPGLSRIDLPLGTSVEEALAIFRSDPAVLYAEPNYHIEITTLPNDPQFGQLWGLNNEGQTGGILDADIDAPQAWDVTTGSPSTIVAVIDTGVDYTHPDLQANIWVNDAELHGLPSVDDDGNGFVDDVHGYDFANNDADPMDDHSHGTHVAGTIGAVGNNGLGVAGVAWNVQLMPIKFLGANGGGNLADAVDAIEYAVANGAQLSNNSWGFNGGFSQALFDAIAAARDGGHVFVAAAGNGNALGVGLDNDITPFYPAGFALDNIMAVAALDHNDERATFSNFGATTVDLGGPGVNIVSTVPGSAYNTFSGTSMASPHVAGVTALVRDLHPVWSYTQVIDAVLETVDPVSELQGDSVTGGRVNAARAVNFAGPEIRLLHAGRILASGLATVDYQNALIGVPVAKSFTVTNVGLEDLLLGTSISVPAGFQVTQPFSANTLAPGESATFEVSLTANQLGQYTGDLSFTTNDADESLVTVQLVGVVSTVQFIDNGESGFAATGGWLTWPNQGYQNDIHYKAAGSGAAVASWTFQVTPGLYSVASTWFPLNDRATNAPYAVTDGNAILVTSQVNQKLAANDFFDQGTPWESLAVLPITGNSLVVELSNAANGYVIADGLRIERLGDLPPDPEVEIRVAGQVVDDDTGHVDFGSTLFEVAQSKTFTIRNTGGDTLTIDSNISLPMGYSLSAPLAATTLDPGATTTFSVSLDASAIDVFAGQIVLLTNDLDEATYNFDVRGDVVAAAIIDNGQPGFSTIGAWPPWSGEGYQNDIHYSAAGTGADVARWTFAVAPGQYRVAATWSTLANRATNAVYAVLNNTTTVATRQVNQELPPNDFVDAGAAWETLGIVDITSSYITVELNDAANEYVIADAIRVERIDLPPTPEIEVTLDGNVVPGGTSTIDFGQTLLGVPVTKTLTIENTGGLDLILDGPSSVPAGFAVIPTFVSFALAPGQSTTLDVQLTGESIGTFGGQLDLHSNDADEDVFSLSLAGSITASQSIDNGATGFATIGNWTPYFGQGLAGDIHYAPAGNGSSAATWTFAISPGEYRVSATWFPLYNRATDAPFTVLDGGQALVTLDVNQELAPQDFQASGAGWKDLGTYAFTSNELAVRLTNNANEYVIADAVLVERVGDLPSGPEIEVLVDGQALVDGNDSVSFGQVLAGATPTKTVTIKNIGAGDLVIESPPVVPPGFTVTSPPQFNTLSSGQSTAFEMALATTTAGLHTGIASIDTNDADEDPFDFQVLAEVVSSRIIDNGAAGFATTGQWSPWPNEGFAGDIHYSAAGVGNDTATWTFAVAPGDYEVSVTWHPLPNRATNTPFSVFDGGTALGLNRLNQELAPNDFTDAGAAWETLGVFSILGSSLIVQVSDDADEYVIADAVRIERLNTQPISIQPLAAPTTDAAVTELFGDDGWLQSPKFLTGPIGKTRPVPHTPPFQDGRVGAWNDYDPRDAKDSTLMPRKVRSFNNANLDEALILLARI